MRLIITEKPSVARDIARVLGARSRKKGYIEGKGLRIAWCVGHMATLAEPVTYRKEWKRWSASTLPMIPEAFELAPIGSSRDQFRVLRAQLRDGQIEEVVNACDAGREGELIFRYVYELAGARKPVRRLWLASMTDTAIRQAFKELRPGTEYDALGDAARCRSEADWLVGLNATRAMTIRCRQAGASELMSVGRVQTPTLAMIVEREQEIEAFEPQTFWQVYATFDAGEQPEGVERTYEGTWTRKKEDRTFKKKEAVEVLEAIEGQTGEVVKIKHKDVKRSPPPLFDLTRLQREANQRFGFSAQKTLSLAQSLYEEHKLITYPRTDSNYLTTDMKAELPGVLEAIAVAPYQEFCEALLEDLPLYTGKRIVHDDEVGDHHAIIPTDRAPNLEKLDRDTRRVYDMIARRFIAAFYPKAVFATTKIATAVAGHVFATSGKVRKEAGWQVVDPPPKYKRGAKKREPILPSVARGDEVPVAEHRLHEGSTSPPKRYSENRLLGAMERAGSGLEDDVLRRAMKESGLGTPATRASVIETLLKRDYIKRQGKTLRPMARGRALIGAIPSPVIKSPELTGQWEARLGQVARGETPREAFMAEVRELTRELIEAMLTQEIELPEEALDPTREVLGRCPVCGGEVFAGRKAYTCTSGRDCSFVIFKRIAGRKTSPGLVKLLLSGKTSRVLKGFKSKKGKRFRTALRLNDEGKVDFVFGGDGDGDGDGDEDTSSSSPSSSSSRQASSSRASSKPSPSQESASAPEDDHGGPLTCPRCEQGRIIRGRQAWGCTRWRQGCDFTVAYVCQGAELEQRDAERLLREGVTGPLEALGGARLLLDLEAEGHVRVMS